MHFAMPCHGGHACSLPVLHAVACNLDWLVMAMHVYRWRQDQGCVPLCQPGWLAMPPRLPKRKVTRLLLATVQRAPARVHQRAVECGLVQAAVDDVVRAAHPLPQRPARGHLRRHAPV